MDKRKNAYRTRKRGWLAVFAGLFLLLGGIFLGNSLIEAVRVTNGMLSTQKVVVSVKNPLESRRTVNFTLDDIRNLEESFSGRLMTWTAYPQVPGTVVSHGAASMMANVAGTNYRYQSFDQLALSSGSFLTRQNEEEDQAVAVIQDIVAWNLFKTDQVVGRTVILYNTPFTIAGVLKTETGLLQTLTDDGLPRIYITAEKLLELDGTAKITCLQVQSGHTGTTANNANEISSALQSAGKNPGDYVIADYQTGFRLLSQKPQFVLWVFGFAAIMILAVYAIKKGTVLVKRIWLQSRDEGFGHAVRNIIPNNGTALLQVTGSLAASILLWLAMRFQPYIPPQYVPDDFINLSYYLNLFKNGVQQSISMMGYVTPSVTLLLNAAGACMNVFAFILPAAGVILLISGLLKLFRSGMDLPAISLVTVFLVFLSLVLTAAAARLLGLPVTIETKATLVSWAFIYIVEVYFYIRKERDYEQVV